MSQSLQSLAARIAELEDVTLAAGGEVPPGSELEAAWIEVQNALEVKVDNYAEYTISLESRADGLEAAARKVLARAKAMRNLRERLLGNADRVMAERTELVGDCFSLKRKLNPPRVEVIDDWRVRLSCPEAVKRTPLENGTYEVAETPQGNVVYALSIDKNALKDCLKRGQHIDGAMLVQGHRIEVV